MKTMDPLAPSDHSSQADFSTRVDSKVSGWQAGRSIILKTTVLPVEQLESIHLGSAQLRNAFYEARGLEKQREASRKASLTACDEMLVRSWNLELPTLDRQHISNRVVKLRSKILKRKLLTPIDLLKITEMEGQLGISGRPFMDYQSCSKEFNDCAKKIPDFFLLSEKETQNRLEIFQQRAADSSRCRMPAFTNELDNHHDYRTMNRSDWKWLYKKSSHMTLKNGFSSEANLCVLGEQDPELDVRLAIDFTGRETRYLIFESWALDALACSFEIDRSLLTPSMNWRACLQPLFDYSPQSAKLAELRALVDLVEKYQEECNPEKALHLAKCLATSFEAMTGQPALKRTKRHRFIFNGITFDHGAVHIGGDLAWQINHIGQLLGKYLEAFAASMLSRLTLADGTLCLKDEIFNEAVDQSLKCLTLPDSLPSCAFFYGIDFSICGSSIQAINEGYYDLILGDINLFPGGLGMFSQCQDLPLTPLIHQDLWKLAHGLTVLTKKQPLGILVDSEAWLTNSRWEMEVRAIQQSCAKITEGSPQIIPFYPQRHSGLQIDKNVILFGEKNIGALCWFLRDIYYSHASHFQPVSSQPPILNHPFFMYALENKIVLDQIVCKMAAEHRYLKIRTRKQRQIRISDFLRRYSLFTFAGEKKLEAWLSLEKELAGLGEHLFIKPVLGKTFCPIYVNTTSVAGLHTLQNFLESCQQRGIEDVILEEMRPSVDELWLEQAGEHYSAELRCFYLRSVEQEQ